MKVRAALVKALLPHLQVLSLTSRNVKAPGVGQTIAKSAGPFQPNCSTNRRPAGTTEHLLKTFFPIAPSFYFLGGGRGGPRVQNKERLATMGQFLVNRPLAPFLLWERGPHSQINADFNQPTKPNNPSFLQRSTLRIVRRNKTPWGCRMCRCPLPHLSLHSSQCLGTASELAAAWPLGPCPTSPTLASLWPPLLRCPVDRSG